MKFPEDVTVGVGIYGLSLMLEYGEQKTLSIAFLEDGVTLDFFFGRRYRMFPLHSRMLCLGLVMVNPRLITCDNSG
jgi:hypothetical protein